MPTGYTAEVADGTVTEFKDFALRCARAFGAFVHMRDDPGDAPLRPDTESTYYAKAVLEAETELAHLRTLTEEQWRDEWRAWWGNEQADHRRRVAETAQKRGRYEAMIAAVSAWVSPSPDHAEFKKFMLDQLQSSIKFDCYNREPSVQPDLPSWRADTLAQAQRSVVHLREEAAKDHERIASRNRWARQLFESLGVQQEAPAQP